MLGAPPADIVTRRPARPSSHPLLTRVIVDAAMKLTPFLLDQWLPEPADGPIELDLGGSTGPHWTFRELLHLEGADARDPLLDSDGGRMSEPSVHARPRLD